MLLGLLQSELATPSITTLVLHCFIDNVMHEVHLLSSRQQVSAMAVDIVDALRETLTSIRFFEFVGYDDLSIADPDSDFVPRPTSITTRLANVLSTCQRLHTFEFNTCHLGYNGIRRLFQSLPDSMRLLIFTRIRDVDLFDGEVCSTSSPRATPLLGCLLALPRIPNLRVRCPSQFLLSFGDRDVTMREAIASWPSDPLGVKAELEATCIDLDTKLSVLDEGLIASVQAHCDGMGVIWERSLQ